MNDELREQIVSLEADIAGLITVLRELLDAMDHSIENDDIQAMVRYGEAEKSARAALAALPTTTGG